MFYLKISYATFLLIISYFIFPIWTLMLSIWFIIYAFIKLRNLDSLLNSLERTIFTIVVFFYPLIETVIKANLNFNLIPYSWHWVNRIEHFAFSLVLPILFYPILKKSLLKLNFIEQSLFSIGIVVLLGNLNEFFEYFLRKYILNLTTVEKFSVYYWDTIYDLVINVLGAIFGYIVLRFLIKSNR